LAHENINDFRVDPLLNLHINYNLAELLRISSEYLQECPLKNPAFEVAISRKRKEIDTVETNVLSVKRNKICENSVLSLTANGLETSEDKNTIGQTCMTRDVDVENVTGCHSSFECFADDCLRKTCNTITEKYLSTFTSRLVVAQKDFNASFTEVRSLHFSLIFELRQAILVYLSFFLSSVVIVILILGKFYVIQAFSFSPSY
jgi:E3 ubiquitin-protein ligase SHPRH